MSRSIAPNYSRARVNLAGRNARSGTATAEDLEVISNWKSSHAHILNSFQTTLRNKNDGSAQIVQRLKRLPTIIDKMKRKPNFSLTEMQDIAGCRVICDDVNGVISYRKRFLQSRIDHKNNSKLCRYNYILSPKPDGYRVIHDVFQYNSNKKASADWRNLRVEIQYRTKIQNYWATAVEVAGFLTENDPKFGRGAESYIEFFRCPVNYLLAGRKKSRVPYPGRHTNIWSIEFKK